MNLQPKWMRQTWGGRGSKSQKKLVLFIPNLQAGSDGFLKEYRQDFQQKEIAGCGLGSSSFLLQGAAPMSVAFVIPQAQLTVKDTALEAPGMGFYLTIARILHQPVIAVPENLLFLPPGHSRAWHTAQIPARDLHHSNRETVLILTQTQRNSEGAINMSLLHLLF